MSRTLGIAFTAVLMLFAAAVQADDYSDTLTLFKNARESGPMLKNAYGYAIFPTIGKGGLVVGGAYGKGRVYEKGVYIGDTSMTQVSIGFQAGGQGYSQLILFQDKRSLDEFTAGNFEFSADVSAVAITAAAGASAGTSGASSSASGGKKDAATAGQYYKGVAVYTIVKGGAMYQATVAGQKFKYTPKG